MELPVEGLTRKPLPWEDALLIPLGDIQHQTDENAVDWSGLRRTIEFGVEHNAMWIGMGDFVDMESPSNRRALQSSGMYDSVMDALDAQAEDLEEKVKEVLKPTVGRWLGVLEGHHYHVHQDGTTSDMRFAQYLKCPFLGTSAYINLQFNSPSKTHANPSFNIWAHHGQGGGALAGSAANMIEKKVLGFDSDIYLVGHTHRASVTPVNRVYPVWGKTKGYLEDRKLLLVNTGSYLKGYQEGSKRNGRANGSYPEKGFMNPLTLQSARIWFRPTWHKTSTGGKYGVPVVEITGEA